MSPFQKPLWPVLGAAALMLLGAAAPASPSERPPQVQSPPVDAELLARIRTAGAPLAGQADDYDGVIGRARDVDFVLLGENTHGTAEFYVERARITMRLVREAGFRAVVLEADWPAAARINAFLRGEGGDRTAAEALSGFEDFASWTWRNAEFAAFLEALREYNLGSAPSDRVGVYGMDVSDLSGAIRAVRGHLGVRDTALLQAVDAHYACFDRLGDDPDGYGQATRRPGQSCESAAAEASALLSRLPAPDGLQAKEAHFDLVRQAAHVAAAEAYYRAVGSGSYSWNVRDRNMVAAVEAVADHVRLPDRGGRVVVWAHNTHVGDARATDMPLRGEVNLGQLLKERHGPRALSLGFLTYSGQVLAAPEWGENGRRYPVRPALPESSEALLHSLGLPRAVYWSDAVMEEDAPAFSRLQRAIGVVYRPREERAAHYFHAALTQQFDGVVFLAQTGAVTLLPAQSRRPWQATVR